MEHKKEVKEKKLDISENIFLKDEHVIYHNGDIFITNRRIIKHGSGMFSKFHEFFSEDYQDMDLQKIVSVKIEEQMNLGFVKIGTLFLLLIPFVLLIGEITALERYVSFITFYATQMGIVLLFLSLLFYVVSFAKKRKVMSVFGEGSARMDFHEYDHKDFLAIRNHQYHNK
ncbi:hypothetical protein GOV08_01360 [Candidatus Woesearchaeota archaeon]|nr:hypothetical protein [Candidatus Woesearchaeota archaeon]